METETCPGLAQATPLEEQAQDLEQYREGVETLMKLGSDKVISNSQPAHAAILFEIFFKYSTQYVRIFCRRLSHQVFDTANLVHEAEKALKRNVEISVMVQEDPPESSAFLDLLRSKGAKVCQAPEDSRNVDFNFAVMDGRAIRTEYDRDNCRAQAKMNAPEVGSLLSAAFQNLAARCRS